MTTELSLTDRRGTKRGTKVAEYSVPRLINAYDKVSNALVVTIYSVSR